MIQDKKPWKSINFFVYRENSFQSFNTQDNEGMSELLKDRDGSKANPATVLTELDFIKKSGSIAGIDIFNIKERPSENKWGVPLDYESPELYRVMSEHDHMTFWTAPSGLLIVVFFSSNPNTLLSMSDQLAKVATIELTQD